MSTASSVNFLQPAELVRAYPSLNNDSIRNSVADLITSYALKGHKLIGDNMSYNPFPSSSWESWDNITVEGIPEKYAKDTVTKHKTTKTTDGKRIELEETEQKQVRLKNAISFNSNAKNAISFVITNVIHEFMMARQHITAVMTESQICDAVVNNNTGDYCVSSLIFTITETIDDTRMNFIFDKNVGKFASTLTTHLSKIFKDSIVLQNLAHKVIVKFVKAFSLYIASQSWFEAKPVEEEKKDGTLQPPTEQYVGVPKNLGDKIVKQFLMDRDLLLMPVEDRLSGQFFQAMGQYDYQTELYENEKKTTNAKKREENKAAKQAAETAKLAAAANATAEVPPPNQANQPVQAPVVQPAVQIAAAVAVANTPVVNPAPLAPQVNQAPAIEAAGRRRRNVQ